MDAAHQADDGAGAGQLGEEPLGAHEHQPLAEEEEGVAPEVAGEAGVAEGIAGGAEGVAKTEGLRGIRGGRCFSHQHILGLRWGGDSLAS